MPNQPLTVAWISDFPVEWLADVPEPLRALPRRHPATWQMVLLEEFEKDPALRVHVVMLRARIRGDFTFERKGVVYHVLKAPGWSRLASCFWVDTLRIRRLCRRIQPNLVHAWGVEKGAALIASRLRCRYLMTVQGLLGWYRELTPLSPYFKLIELLERRSLPRAPVVTTESNFAVRFLRERYPHIQIMQAEHAPNRAFFGVRRRPQLTPLHFISVGTLSFRKGTDLLFQGLDQLAAGMPFKLTLVTGEHLGYLEELRPRVSARLWERVQIKQQILPPAVAQELETPTMLLLPTRADTSPNAAKESAVAGVPVVAANVGGLPDYVVHGKNGLLFRAGDLADFVRTLEAACAHESFSQGRVDPETLARARAYLSPERMAENFLAAYRAALR